MACDDYAISNCDGASAPHVNEFGNRAMSSNFNFVWGVNDDRGVNNAVFS